MVNKVNTNYFIPVKNGFCKAAKKTGHFFKASVLCVKEHSIKFAQTTFGKMKQVVSNKKFYIGFCGFLAALAGVITTVALAIIFSKKKNQKHRKNSNNHGPEPVKTNKTSPFDKLKNDKPLETLTCPQKNRAHPTGRRRPTRIRK